ncbi:hypothetical protein OAE46_01165, partial [bacterium]|nr:hypothetical protein [bacterium]
FEDFVRDPLDTCREVFRFLGVDESFEPKIEVHNKGRMPKYPGMQWRFRKVADFPTRWFPRFVRRIAERLMKWNIEKGREAKAPVDCLERLDALYRPGFEALEELTGLQVVERWSPAGKKAGAAANEAPGPEDEAASGSLSPAKS